MAAKEFKKVSELNDIAVEVLNQLSEQFRTDYHHFLDFEIEIDTENCVFVIDGDCSITSSGETEMVNITPASYIQFADFEVDFRKEYLSKLEELINKQAI